MSLRSSIDFASSVILLVIAVLVAENMLTKPSSVASRPAEMALPRSPVPLSSVPMLGSPSAPLVMLEFSDFECPYCGRYARETFPAIKAKYVTPGLLRLAFRHLPNSATHPNAVGLSLSAKCADEQGRFWHAYEVLHAPAPAERPTTAALAQLIGVDGLTFSTCLGRTHVAALDHDRQQAADLGVDGTPTFLIGLPNEANAAMQVAEIVSGAAPLSTFERAISRAMALRRGSK